MAAWFLALLALAVLVSVVVLRQVGANRIDAQSARDLSLAVDDLRARLQQDQGAMGRPGGPTVASVFEEFLRARPARGDEAYVTFVGGRSFAASAGAATRLDELPIAARWAALAVPAQGRERTPAGTIRWVGVPVRSGDQVLGVLVAAEFLRGQQQALHGTIVTVSLVMVLVLLGAGVLAWAAAGRALSPVTDLAQAARRVSGGDDLTARVEVTGHDEVADLGDSINGMLARLQSAFDSQKRFLDAAAHELRTPISIARGHVELVDADPVELDATRTLVLDELDRMERLVTDLRQLARSERPDFLTLETLDVDALLREVGLKVEAMAERTWVVEAASGAHVAGDRQRITQALLNLVDNAVHVTGEGDRIALGSTRRGPDVDLWVEDEGPGIAERDLATLFDREGRSVPRRPGGTGLGLPLVAAIARAHGGEVSAASSPGHGARFVITLPGVET